MLGYLDPDVCPIGAHLARERAYRDEHVRLQRLIRLRRDRRDTETEADVRWELRAQARVAIAAYRSGRGPHPGALSSHRRRHSDATRREFAS